MSYRPAPNLLPCEFAACNVGDDYVAFAVKTHDLHADGACSAALDLVLVAEEVDARLATAIIQTAFHEHAQHGTFTGVNC